MRMLIDHRERAPELEAELIRLGVRVHRAPLLLADYRIGNHLLIERKTLADLRVSLRDGRLFDQAQRLYHWRNSEPGHRVALLLEGPVRHPGIQVWERRLIQGAMLKLSLFWDLPVFRAFCQEESARLMLYAARQYLRQAWVPQSGGNRSGNPSASPHSKYRVQQRLLQSLPGIGWRRAEVLLKHFGTIKGIVNAEESELASVEGIGTQLAQRIKSMVNDPRGDYGCDQNASRFGDWWR